MNPEVHWDEGDLVVIDLSGEGLWLKQGDEYVHKPEGTWWVSPEIAEKLLVALSQFLHPKEEDGEEDGCVF